MKRCINIDWLEVFCNEGTVAKDPALFEAKGFKCEVRAYGSPQYKQMFTIFDGPRPLYEVRRLPYSLKSAGGIFEEGACHIRLSNRACYAPGCIQSLRRFLDAFGFVFLSVSRIDICCDFVKFDNQMQPQKLLNNYLSGKISKLNQSRVASFGQELQVSDLATHGRDSWKFGRLWNSVSWGSKTSSISAKLYNKSLEMKQVKPKFHIIDAWKACGLDFENNDVWRVEFSLKSSIKGYVSEDSGELRPSTLSTYDTQEKLWWSFFSLQEKYFNFRKVEYLNGKPKRKDRCPRLNLFKFNAFEPWKPVRLTLDQEPTRTDRILINRLKSMLAEGVPSPSLEQAAVRLIAYFAAHKRFSQTDFDYKLVMQSLRQS